MGLNKNATRFLLYCRTLDVDFTRTALVGRQRLKLSKRDLKGIFESFGYKVDAQQIDLVFNQNNKRYAERLLTCLGAKEVHSFDKSGYEGATHLHDMNLELPDSLTNQYSTVLDSGSLEHIFNFPVAIKNCMEMVKVGGHYLSITPANNWFGHGFYQFSPELYFSVFTRKNGFELTSVIAFETRPNARWYFVKSPLEVGGRVTLTNSVPVNLLVVARKLAHARVFETTPQQSDYLSIWHEEDTDSDGAAQTPPTTKLAVCRDFIRRKVLASAKKRILKVYWFFNSRFNPRFFNSRFNPRFFRPMDPTSGRESPKALQWTP
jgi:hypothetical protein